MHPLTEHHHSRAHHGLRTHKHCQDLTCSGPVHLSRYEALYHHVDSNTEALTFIVQDGPQEEGGELAHGQGGVSQWAPAHHIAQQLQCRTGTHGVAGVTGHCG
jgi:hypothetical protein